MRLSSEGRSLTTPCDRKCVRHAPSFSIRSRRRQEIAKEPLLDVVIDGETGLLVEEGHSRHERTH